MRNTISIYSNKEAVSKKDFESTLTNCINGKDINIPRVYDKSVNTRKEYVDFICTVLQIDKTTMKLYHYINSTLTDEKLDRGTFYFNEGNFEFYCKKNYKRSFSYNTIRSSFKVLCYLRAIWPKAGDKSVYHINNKFFEVQKGFMVKTYFMIP